MPHTPGPWTYEVHQLSEGYSGIVYGANGMRIGTDHLSEEDARLIAAAPAMLVAAKAMIACLGGQDGYFATAGKTKTDALRAAIAQAEGDALMAFSPTKLIGTVEKIAFTQGGAGNQWTTIDGIRYATWWDIRRTDWKVGDQVEFEAYRGPLWSGNPDIDCARNIHKVAERRIA